ncbi:MAG: phosphate ABC transporter permease PstA [Gammaproteobacteria bacterium]|nr:phosphate ABC transporter permease PstA [Gammaproteobacteria bacterium]
MKVARLQNWAGSGTPFIWITASAVAISLIMVVGLLSLLAFKGMGHFWPKQVMQGNYNPPIASRAIATSEFIGERVQFEAVAAEQLADNGFALSLGVDTYQRQLVKFGNRDLSESDFGWIVMEFTSDIAYPADIVVLERRRWGNLYGYMESVLQQAKEVVPNAGDQSTDETLWQDFQQRLQRTAQLLEEISLLESRQLARINRQIEQLRRQQSRNELLISEPAQDLDADVRQLSLLESQYGDFQTRLNNLAEQVNRDSVRLITANNQRIEIPLSEIIRAYRPNQLDFTEKLTLFMTKVLEFVADDPREGNTEGGIFPAIFGTVVMVLLMSMLVAPFGVIAAIYLREYARQGLLTRIIRIAVNNLAGVPSIVYGVFGLGFFIYIVGGEIDRQFFAEALPAPTFGTPGLLWASLTLALLTMPVVIVATEEGLARVPRSLREGSLALGATKFETIVKVVFPIASPAMMTGLMLAIARAAGTVAPLMLVGVVKLAPSLPVNGLYPYLHLNQKFMHLGYHIYGVGLQSPNTQAAMPLVFATALLLVAVIALLNFSAAVLRNRLREGL